MARSSIEPELQALAKSLGVKIHNAGHWRQAVTHQSFANEHEGAGESYERLEFLGDALLNAAVAQVLYEQLPESPEGELSFLRSALVRKEALAVWALKLPLGEALRLGQGARDVGNEGRATILADAAEAVLAAIFLDSGWDVLLTVVRDGPAAVIPDYHETRLQLEPKSVLQEYLARVGKGVPVYETVMRRDGRVEVRVRWPGGMVAAEGRNRKEAESDAARRALDTLWRMAESRT